ncbi:hypothetical protein IC620_10035 [Hazenella sp. IB182357]|uniref:Uncharacterized protein n=1 Tax=Polycladospora coralii TaxID=2771432 RepID=A0A926N6B4_9BACL|nr:hypothetical protein [Polycladospora coralii]MBS7531088.1 hypothetical protein [Polycladospora coralii]
MRRSCHCVFEMFSFSQLKKENISSTTSNFIL